MNVTFEVLKEDVLYQIKQETFITGESFKEGTPVDKNRATKTQASDDDDYLLSQYIDTAASTVCDLLTGHLTTVEYSQEDATTSKGSPTTKYVYDCDVPSTYDVNQNNSIVQGIADYMAAFALYRWYKRVEPKMADASELEQIKSDINHRINQRVRPVRRIVLPDNF